jgi:hypothetical protein
MPLAFAGQIPKFNMTRGKTFYFSGKFGMVAN